MSRTLIRSVGVVTITVARPDKQPAMKQAESDASSTDGLSVTSGNATLKDAKQTDLNIGKTPRVGRQREGGRGSTWCQTMNRKISSFRLLIAYDDPMTTKIINLFQKVKQKSKHQ